MVLCSCMPAPVLCWVAGRLTRLACRARCTGWRPVLLSWLEALPPAFPDGHKEALLRLFDWLVPPCLRLVAKQLPAVLRMVDINLVASTMRLLDAHLDEFK